MTHPKDNLEWLVDKIERKLRMFLKTKDIGYLEKAESLLQDLRNEHELWKAWEELSPLKRAIRKVRGETPSNTDPHPY